MSKQHRLLINNTYSINQKRSQNSSVNRSEVSTNSQTLLVNNSYLMQYSSIIEKQELEQQQKPQQNDIQKTNSLFRNLLKVMNAEIDAKMAHSKIYPSIKNTLINKSYTADRQLEILVQEKNNNEQLQLRLMYDLQSFLKRQESLNSPIYLTQLEQQTGQIQNQIKTLQKEIERDKLSNLQQGKEIFAIDEQMCLPESLIQINNLSVQIRETNLRNDILSKRILQLDQLDGKMIDADIQIQGKLEVKQKEGSIYKMTVNPNLEKRFNKLNQDIQNIMRIRKIICERDKVSQKVMNLDNIRAKLQIQSTDEQYNCQQMELLELKNRIKRISQILLTQGTRHSDPPAKNYSVMKQNEIENNVQDGLIHHRSITQRSQSEKSFTQEQQVKSGIKVAQPLRIPIISQQQSNPSGKPHYSQNIYDQLSDNNGTKEVTQDIISQPALETQIDKPNPPKKFDDQILYRLSDQAKNVKRQSKHMDVDDQKINQIPPQNNGYSNNLGTEYSEFIKMSPTQFQQIEQTQIYDTHFASKPKLDIQTPQLIVYNRKLGQPLIRIKKG